jgi:hypothetical protein
MRHLVDRHVLAGLAVFGEEFHWRGYFGPQIEGGHSLLAEQAHQIGMRIVGQHRIERVLLKQCQGRDDGFGAREIAQKHLASLPDRPGKAAAWHIDQAHGFARRRNVGHQRQCLGIEHLHPAGFIVRHRHQPPVVRNRPADGIARLHRARDNALRQQVHLGQPAVAAEDIGKALVRPIGQRGVGQIAQPFDPRQRGTVGPVDQHQAAGGAFHHQAKVAGRGTGRSIGRGLLRRKRQGGKCKKQDGKAGSGHGSLGCLQEAGDPDRLFLGDQRPPGRHGGARHAVQDDQRQPLGFGMGQCRGGQRLTQPRPCASGRGRIRNPAAPCGAALRPGRAPHRPAPRPRQKRHKDRQPRHRPPSRRPRRPGPRPGRRVRKATPRGR